MTTQEKFVGFTYDEHANYYHQAVEKYGQAVMDEAASRQAGQEEHATEAFNQVFRNLAKNLQQGLKVDAVENQVQAATLLQAIRTYAFDCTLEVFAFIGKGYVANPEFKKNIDQFGVGTAQYVADIIHIYVTQAK